MQNIERSQSSLTRRAELTIMVNIFVRLLKIGQIAQ